MANIREVRLADVASQSVKGKQELVKTNEATFGAILSNRALRYGYENGYIETTKLSDLYEKASEDVEMAWTILYLGLIGANPGIENEIKFDDFVDRLDEPVDEVVYKAQTLFMADLPESYEDFIKELRSKTAKGDGGKK